MTAPGPRATVTLSCIGCPERVPYQDGSFHHTKCTALNKPLESFVLGAPTPDDCPHHPGPVVAVVVPEKRFSWCGGESDYDRHYNECRDDVIESARKLGQEVSEE